jgi:pyrrolidone-carboxylate peptidase
MVLHDQPDYILGMGIYSGKDQDAIRIETVTTNKFRNDPIEKDVADDHLKINYFLKPTDHDVKLASGMGNSWCNLISWKIMRLIMNKKLASQYSFLHIPKTFSSYRTIKIIKRMLA